MPLRFQFFGTTAALWASNNPILLRRELGMEDDTGKFKIGNGVSHWNDLSYGGMKGDRGDSGNTPVKGVDYFDGENGKDGIDGKDSIIPGPKGEDGYTPIKGVDYFDGSNGSDGYIPIKGVDYFDGEDGEDSIVPGPKGDPGEPSTIPGPKGDDGYTPVKNVDYFDGLKGDKGDQGDPANISEHESTYNHSLIHSNSLDHNGSTQDIAISEKEPANANIQAHITSAHAPSDAQKNSDITKAEIEAKLTGEISSHTHAGGSEAFPVGAVFISVVATDPGTLLGYGTWASLGAGRVLVGFDSGDADFNVVEKTGGGKTVQSSAQTFAGNASTSIVNHTHQTTVSVGTIDGTYGTFDSSSTAPGTAKTLTSGNPVSGGVASYTPTGTNTPGAATSVVQPHLVVYMWKRTA